MSDNKGVTSTSDEYEEKSKNKLLKLAHFVYFILVLVTDTCYSRAKRALGWD